MSQVCSFVRECKKIDLMPSRDGTQLMKRTDLVAFIRRVGNSMAKVKDSHWFDVYLVGAAGFEPTTSREYFLGALTAELYAYSVPLPHTDGIHRIILGPRTFVQANGIFFHKIMGMRNFWSTGLK